MGWFSGFFNKNTSVVSTNAQVGMFSYSDRLMTTLEQEHILLLQMYTEIQQMMQGGAYADISPQICEFKEQFKHHLVTENSTLYTYLKDQLANDTQQLQKIADFRREMHHIANTLIRFSKKWTEHQEIDLHNVYLFNEEYNTIGGVLIQRINTEESLLHPLYQPRKW